MQCDAAAFGDGADHVAELAGDRHHHVEPALALLVVVDRQRKRHLAQLDARKREAHRQNQRVVLAVPEREPVGGVERDRGVVGVGGRRFAWNDLLEELVAAQPGFELGLDADAERGFVLVGEERFHRGAIEVQCTDRARPGFLEHDRETLPGAVPHQFVRELPAGIVDAEHGLAQIVETFRDIVADADERILPRFGDVLDLRLDARVAFGQFVGDNAERVVERNQDVRELRGGARGRLPRERAGAELRGHVLHGGLGFVDIGLELVRDRFGRRLERLDIGFEFFQARLRGARRRSIPQRGHERAGVGEARADHLPGAGMGKSECAVREGRPDVVSHHDLPIDCWTGLTFGSDTGVGLAPAQR